jgi:hypothetical protein
MMSMDNFWARCSTAVGTFCRAMPVVCRYTAFLRFTPHHKTGARLVAQSKVNKLINHVMTSTGTGARRTSVRLRKGKAKVSLAS